MNPLGSNLPNMQSPNTGMVNGNTMDMDISNNGNNGLNAIPGINTIGQGNLENMGLTNSGGGMAHGVVAPVDTSQLQQQPQPNPFMLGHPEPQQLATSQGGAALGNAGVAIEAVGPGAAISDERKHQIQQQLMLLLHAHKCNRSQKLNLNREVCTVNYCKDMKAVLAHMETCKQSKECKMEHCASSRQILLHYKTCQRSDCIICFPFRQHHSLIQTKGEYGGGSASADSEKDWRALVTGDLRNHYVELLVQAIFPTSDPTTMQDKRMHNLVSYAEKVENEMYEMAKSISEYYHLLADKINTIQKELEEKRLKRKEQRQQNLSLSHPNVVGGGDGPNSAGAAGNPVLNNEVNSLQQQLQFEVEAQCELLAKLKLAPAEGHMSANTNLNAAASAAVGAGGENDGVKKDWPESVTADLRNHLVEKLVQAIFPTSDPTTLQDQRMHNLVSYAEKVEKDMYEMANSKSEYYHLLAEKIYTIQKELEEKRLKRKEEHQPMME